MKRLWKYRSPKKSSAAKTSLREAEYQRLVVIYEDRLNQELLKLQEIIKRM